MNAKGSSVIPIVVWLTVLVVTLAASYWYVSRLSTEKTDLERIQNDVSSLRQMVDDGCQSSFYRVSFNPFTEQGDLFVHGHQICISLRKLSRCQEPVCRLVLKDANIDLLQIKQLVVVKNGNQVEIIGE
ncbi:MAG: hypothetical protein Q7R47_02770 [Candidatus Diapherotrites archaeon]|nr:hypothetical protein [Candidatus Diapherotrites archaeon]